MLEPILAEPFEIRDNASGGDCNAIGKWDSKRKTCTFTKDIVQPIVIRSSNLVLDGNNHVIDGNYNKQTDSPRHCILLDAKFKITIKNFEITNCAFGITLVDSLENKIIDNKIINNGGGIQMTHSNQNEIRDNLIMNNSNAGILFRGNGNLIQNNKIIDNSHLYLGQDLKGKGIHIAGKESKNNIISNNLVSGHEWGMNFDAVHSSNITKNIVEDNEIGIKLNTSEGFLVEGNTIRDNGKGIQSYMYDGGGKHIIKQNLLKNNSEGAYLDSGKNIITENTFESNSDYGLLLFDVEMKRSTHGNKIFNNNFIDNSRHVVHGEKNSFTVNGFGNYWDDFSSECVDNNADNKCDEPYPFSSGTVGVIDTAVWTEKNAWVGIDLKNKPTPALQKTKEESEEPKEQIQKEIPAPFVDPDKDPQHYIDRYNNEQIYKEWFDENYPQYDSIYQAVGLSEPIPEWVRGVFTFWAEGQISDDELKNAIKFLVNEGIIKLD